jgi:DNA-binding SARP family transcriptional activator
LTIRLLGPPAIERDGGPAPPPRGRKAWALLAYLLLADRPPGRRHLADLLFADADDPLGALRWTLAQLRRTLGAPELFGGDPVATGLADGMQADVHALTGDQATATAWLAEAHARCTRVTDRYQWISAYILDAMTTAALDQQRAERLVDALAALAARGGMRELVRAHLHRGRRDRHLRRHAGRPARRPGGHPAGPVVVESESDHRGMLGVADEVAPGPLQVRVRYRLSAPGVPAERVRALVDWAERHAPVNAATATRCRWRSRSR